MFLDQQVHIQNYKYIHSNHKIEEDNYDVVVEWLARIEQKYQIKKLKEYNIKTLKDIKNLTPESIDGIFEDDEEKERFK